MTTKEEKMISKEEKAMERECKHVLMSTGHFVWKIRMMSSLSHNEVNMQSPINSSTEWRIENKRNCCIHTYATAFNEHLKALNCNFCLNNLYERTYESIHNGECLVLLSVNPSELYKYDPHQILLQLEPRSEEEQAKLIKTELKNLRISTKLAMLNDGEKRLKKKIHKKKSTKR